MARERPRQPARDRPGGIEDAPVGQRAAASPHAPAGRADAGRAARHTWPARLAQLTLLASLGLLVATVALGVS
ncbi:MAG TPA: hypothetical protein VF486_22550, partial [Actinomycetes bacterium]